MFKYNDTNDDKINAICEIIGVEKFIEVTEVVNGGVYIPQKLKFVRKLVTENGDLFLRILEDIGSLQDAAVKFGVSTKTIRNWIHNAYKSTTKGYSDDEYKLARSLMQSCMVGTSSDSDN